jgi:hypothetical protein
VKVFAGNLDAAWGLAIQACTQGAGIAPDVIGAFAAIEGHGEVTFWNDEA